MTQDDNGTDVDPDRGSGSRGRGVIAAAFVLLVIAEWLYLDWGERTAEMPERYVHREWIELHRGPDFREWVQFLVDELDRVFPDDPAERERLTAVWRHVVGLERAFFDTAYA